jgi:hypothetical protein
MIPFGLISGESSAAVLCRLDIRLKFAMARFDEHQIVNGGVVAAHRILAFCFACKRTIFFFDRQN